jgi:hypothetical protein
MKASEVTEEEHLKFYKAISKVGTSDVLVPRRWGRGG